MRSLSMMGGAAFSSPLLVALRSLLGLRCRLPLGVVVSSSFFRVVRLSRLLGGAFFSSSLQVVWCCFFGEAAPGKEAAPPSAKMQKYGVLDGKKMQNYLHFELFVFAHVLHFCCFEFAPF